MQHATHTSDIGIHTQDTYTKDKDIDTYTTHNIYTCKNTYAHNIYMQDSTTTYTYMHTTYT